MTRSGSWWATAAAAVVFLAQSVVLAQRDALPFGALVEVTSNLQRQGSTETFATETRAYKVYALSAPEIPEIIPEMIVEFRNMHGLVRMFHMRNGQFMTIGGGPCRQQSSLPDVNLWTSVNQNIVAALTTSRLLATGPFLDLYTFPESTFVPMFPQCQNGGRVGIPTSQYTQNGWNSDYSTTIPQLKRVNAAFLCNGSVVQTTNITVSWIAVNIDTSIFATCIPSPGSQLNSIGAEVTQPEAAIREMDEQGQPVMPTFPADVSFVIETTMMERRQTFTVTESISAHERAASVTVESPTLDPIGRRVLSRTIVSGKYQMAYNYQSVAVPAGYTSSVSPGIRNYFWPDAQTCTRVAFSLDLISGSVASLFLSAAANRVFLGNATVRGVRCMAWQQSTRQYTVVWYWTANSVPALVRITIQGTGRSPLFVHHPFYQQGNAFPSTKPEPCQYFFTRNDPHCSNAAGQFYHVHEITQWVPASHASDWSLPSECTTTSSVAQFPPSVNDSVSDGTVIALVFLMSAISLCGGCFCMYLRLSPQLRAMKKQLRDIGATPDV